MVVCGYRCSVVGGHCPPSAGTYRESFVYRQGRYGATWHGLAVYWACREIVTDGGTGWPLRFGITTLPAAVLFFAIRTIFASEHLSAHAERYVGRFEERHGIRTR